jgi:hypothetical protein
MDLRETGWGGMDWIYLAQDKDQRWALVKTVTNLRVPTNFGKFLSSCTTGGFSRKAQLYGALVCLLINVFHFPLQLLLKTHFVPMNV